MFIFQFEIIYCIKFSICLEFRAGTKRKEHEYWIQYVVQGNHLFDFRIEIDFQITSGRQNNDKLSIELKSCVFIVQCSIWNKIVEWQTHLFKAYSSTFILSLNILCTVHHIQYPIIKWLGLKNHFSINYWCYYLIFSTRMEIYLKSFLK